MCCSYIGDGDYWANKPGLESRRHAITNFQGDISFLATNVTCRRCCKAKQLLESLPDETTSKIFPNSAPNKLVVGFYVEDVLNGMTPDFVSRFGDKFDVYLLAKGPVNNDNLSAKDIQKHFEEMDRLILFNKKTSRLI